MLFTDEEDEEFLTSLLLWLLDTILLDGDFVVDFCFDLVLLVLVVVRFTLTFAFLAVAVAVVVVVLLRRRLVRLVVGVDNADADADVVDDDVVPNEDSCITRSAIETISSCDDDDDDGGGGGGGDEVNDKVEDGSNLSERGI